MFRTILIAAVSVAASAQTAETPPDPAAGKKIFESQCALCHGQNGGGGRGPSLNRPKLGHAPDDDALRKVISQGIQPEMPGAWQLHPREVASLAAYVRSLGAVPPENLSGDAARGERIYQSKGCAGCHMIAGKGEGFGPELTGIGTRRNGAYLRQTLLRPADSLPEGFLYVAATTRAGETVRGIRINEDSFTIQIKDAHGRFHSFRKSDLKDLQRLKNQTPMPSFESALSASELDDLTAYLAGLKGTL
ncbi:MAG TPA: c-type cytochrome [Bryobacteraceae bacterium]|jgi:putative heme-binding domain-containing protein